MIVLCTKHNIYACNIQTTANYYREIPLHPDWILRDLIAIFHPEMMKDYQNNIIPPQKWGVIIRVFCYELKISPFLVVVRIDISPIFVLENSKFNE
jgi:hypothetical protein